MPLRVPRSVARCHARKRHCHDSDAADALFSICHLIIYFDISSILFRHYFTYSRAEGGSAAACISLRFSAASTLLLSLMIAASPRPAFFLHSIDAFSFLLRYAIAAFALRDGAMTRRAILPRRRHARACRLLAITPFTIAFFIIDYH
jgi:hypothetical protein